jgi:hypothetical protein
MTDKPVVPFHVQMAIGRLLDEKTMEQMNRSCELALKKQLNKNKTDPILSKLEKEWGTMDRFSKRELGQSQTKSNLVLPVTAQLAPGQKAAVVGPSTIQGGNIKIEK